MFVPRQGLVPVTLAVAAALPPPSMPAVPSAIAAADEAAGDGDAVALAIRPAILTPPQLSLWADAVLTHEGEDLEMALATLRDMRTSVPLVTANESIVLLQLGEYGAAVRAARNALTQLRAADSNNGYDDDYDGGSGGGGAGRRARHDVALLCSWVCGLGLAMEALDVDAACKTFLELSKAIGSRVAVDFTPLGLDYCLHIFEVLFNAAACLWQLGLVEEAARELSDARILAASDSHFAAFNAAMATGFDHPEFFTIPIECGLIRPPRPPRQPRPPRPPWAATDMPRSSTETSQQTIRSLSSTETPRSADARARPEVVNGWAQPPTGAVPLPGVQPAPLQPRPTVGPVTNGGLPPPPSVARAYLLESKNVFQPERAGAAIPQRFLPASQDVAVTAYALPKPAVGVLGGGGRLFAWDDAQHSTQERLGSLSDYNDGNDENGRDRTGLLDPSRVSLVSPIHAAVLAMSSGQQQKRAAAEASRELAEALAAARAYRDSWYSGSRTSSIFGRATSYSSEPDDQPTSALLQLASAALARARSPTEATATSDHSTTPVPAAVDSTETDSDAGSPPTDSISRDVDSPASRPPALQDRNPPSSVAFPGQASMAVLAEAKPPPPTTATLTRRAGQLKHRPAQASTLPRSFVLEKAAADVGLVLGPPAAAAATAPAVLPNVTDLAKLAADLGIEPESRPDRSLARNTRLDGLAAAVVPSLQPAPGGGGKRPLQGGSALRTQTLPKAADLAHLADQGVNGNLPRVPVFPAAAQDPDARRAASDVGVDRGRARGAAVAATLPKNMDLARLAASFGSQPAVAASPAQGADLFGPARRGGLGAAATLPKNMDLGRLAADLGIDVASPSRASAESWRDTAEMLPRGRSAAPAQGRAAAVSSAATGATAQPSDRRPGRIAARTSSLTAPAPALTGRKAGGRGGDGNGDGGGVVQETRGLLAAAAAVAARRRPSAASRAGDTVLGRGQTASAFRQVFDGMGPRQNEFLAYADYLVGLDDLIRKNQGGTESIYSFSLDARTGLDGDDYDYEDPTAAFVDEYNGVRVLSFISSNLTPASLITSSLRDHTDEARSEVSTASSSATVTAKTRSTLGSGRRTSTAARQAFAMPMSSSSADAAAAVAARTSVDLRPSTRAIAALKSDAFGSPRSGLPIVAPLALRPGAAATGMPPLQRLQEWEDSEAAARRLEQLPVPDMESWLQVRVGGVTPWEVGGSGGTTAGWRRRWCVLRDRSLYVLRGVLILDPVAIVRLGPPASATAAATDLAPASDSPTAAASSTTAWADVTVVTLDEAAALSLGGVRRQPSATARPLTPPMSPQDASAAGPGAMPPAFAFKVVPTEAAVAATTAAAAAVAGVSPTGGPGQSLLRLQTPPANPVLYLGSDDQLLVLNWVTALVRATRGEPKSGPRFLIPISNPGAGDRPTGLVTAPTPGGPSATGASASTTSATPLGSTALYRTRPGNGSNSRF
ncbi:hypothetical protein HK405_014436 [Cladochytrium tenue]|nr:hypothetical protein HK405_014436 [Cladochytrium tenue]